MRAQFITAEEVQQILSVSRSKSYHYAHLFPSRQAEMADKLNMERGNPECPQRTGTNTTSGAM